MAETALRRNRAFVLFTAGQLASDAGTGLLMLAVLLHVYAASHSTRVTTIAFLAETVPTILLSPWAGVVADRGDRRRILMTADLLRAVLLMPLLVTPRLDMLIGVLAMQSAVGAVFRPAYRSFVPSLVPAGQLASANGVTSSTMAVLMLVCPPVGAALYAAFGFGVVVVIDAVTFLVSVTTLWFVRPAYAVPVQRTDRQSVRADLLGGARVLAARPVVRLLLTTAICFGVLQAILSPVLVPFFEGVLHATPSQIGLAVAAQGVGTLLAGMVVTWLGGRVHPARLFAMGCSGVAVFALFFTLAPNFPFAVAMLVCVGVPGVLLNVGEQTLLQTLVPDQMLGRAMGLLGMAESVATLAGASVPAFATGILGVRGVLLVGASGAFAAAAVALAGYGRIVSTETVTSSSTSGSTSGPTPGPDGTLMCPPSSTNGGVTSRA